MIRTLETMIPCCYYCDEGYSDYYYCTHDTYARDYTTLSLLQQLGLTLIITVVHIIRTPETVVVRAVI